MSLTVYTRRRPADADADDGDLEDVETPEPPHNELAGFESWRTNVWGSGPVVSLGCTVLPLLARGDLYASGALLAALDRDVQLLQASLRQVVDELVRSGTHIVAQVVWVAGTPPRPGPVDPYETIAYRLRNIAEAVRLAKAVPDGAGEVVIS